MEQLTIPEGYTVEIYKRDARTKKGERLVLKQDYDTDDFSMLEHTIKNTWPAAQGYRYAIHRTYVLRRSALYGTEFVERYDVPWTASPRSETYWSS